MKKGWVGMANYEPPIVDGLNSDGPITQGVAAIGETFFASQFYMAAGVAVVVLYLAAWVLPVLSAGESDEVLSSDSQ